MIRVTAVAAHAEDVTGWQNYTKAAYPGKGLALKPVLALQQGKQGDCIPRHRG